MQVLKSVCTFSIVILILTGCGGGGSDENNTLGSVSPPPLWSKLLGVSATATYGGGVTTDLSGNIYVAGYTGGGVDGNTLTGSADIYLTKYDASGNRLFTRLLGASGKATYGLAVAADANGNVYVTGDTNGGLGSNIVTGWNDVFLAKYDASGNLLFVRQLGVPVKNTYGKAVATDATGNVYVSGYTTGGLDGNLLTGWSDFFLIKFDSSGTRLFTKQMGVSGGKYTMAFGVATDASGNVYVSGDTNGGLDGNTSTNSTSLFLTKYDSTGAKVYTKLWGASLVNTHNGGIAIDSSGNIFVSGYTDAGHDPNAIPGTVDSLLAKYDAAGNLIFSRQWGAAQRFTFGQAIATDASGNIYVSGQTDGGLDGNASTGWMQSFFTKHDASGNRIYTRQMAASNASALATGVATDASGSVYITGETGGGLNGNAKIGAQDAFLQKY